MGGGESRFRSLFARVARRVRGPLAASRVLSGAAVGLAVGALATGAAFYFRLDGARPLGAVAGLLGVGVGFGLARLRRFDDEHVALYLDQKLDAAEAITTAQASEDFDEEARAVVVARAEAVLASAAKKRIRPRIFSLEHGLLPVAAAAIVYLSIRPLPPLPPPPPLPPGAARVALADIAGLDKIEALAAVDGRDEAQRERLKALANDAKKLREKLKEGMEQREAQAELSTLKDAIAAERSSFGQGEERRGLESAASKLGENRQLKAAEKALGDRDLVTFDQSMAELADRLEKEDRGKAIEDLERAAEAAKKNGAPNVAKELARQKELLAERGKHADKLRELSKALGDSLGKEGKQDLDEWNATGSGEARRKLEQHLEEALEKLSPEERKRLAENMKKQIESGGDKLAPSKRQDLQELENELETEEGRQRLEDELKRMAQDEESERQKSLDDALKGEGEAEKELGGSPMPIPIPVDRGMPGSGKPGEHESKGKPSPGKPSAGPGEKSEHEGPTPPIAGGEVKSRATAKINKGRALSGVTMGRTQGRAGETADVQGTGALGDVGPEEVSGVERSDVPEEYREQVGRYFQPK